MKGLLIRPTIGLCVLGEPGQAPGSPFTVWCAACAQRNRLAGVGYHDGDTSATDQQVAAYTYLADGRRDALAAADVERVAQAVAEEVQGQQREG